MADKDTRGNAELLDVGVDWLTCTTLSRSSSLRIRPLAERAMVQQKKIGNEVKPWGMSGFDGMKCGAIQVGTRGNETIVRLTGEYAGENWRRFYNLSDNVSRIDLQVTVNTGEAASKVVARHYRQAARARKKSGRFPKVWECRDSDGPATLYFGKRVSALFARVYDKHSQSKGDWPAGAVRYELQCNGQQAQIHAARLFRSRSELLEIESRCRGYFLDHGLGLAWSGGPVSNYCCPRRRSDLECRLLWIKKAVSPSVRLLVDSGMQLELMNALGLSLSKGGKVHTLQLVQSA